MRNSLQMMVMSFVCLLQACGPNQWTKTGASHAEYERDSHECSAAAYDKFPVGNVTVSNTDPAYNLGSTALDPESGDFGINIANSNCHADGTNSNGTNIITCENTLTPLNLPRNNLSSIPESSDINAESRDDYMQTCMKARGWTLQ